LTLSGRKLVGSAQWRDAGVLLQHGSILTRDDQSRIAAFLTTPVDSQAAPATLEEWLGRAPDLAEVAQALRQALQETEDPAAADIHVADLDEAVLARARARYADQSWTWRR
jgi:lipoate-protein ligase A